MARGGGGWGWKAAAFRSDRRERRIHAVKADLDAMTKSDKPQK